MNKGELTAFLPPPDGSKPGCKTLVVSDFPDIGAAVRASSAVPGLFMPVEIRGMKLHDGGVMDQVPVDVVRAMGADFTIGVSLSLAYMPARIHNAPTAIAGMIGILGIQQLRKSLDRADIGFQVSGIQERSVFNSKQHDLIDIGEQDMASYLETYSLMRGGIR